MRVLGLYCGHDSSATVVEDGKVVFAIEEERLTGEKKQNGIPARAIMYICKHLNCSPWDFDKVAIATPSLHWGRPHAFENTLMSLYPDAVLVPHHHAHAVLAYAWSGYDECTVMTCDGGGDKSFATIYDAKDGKLTRLSECLKEEDEAFGMLYYYVTEAVGFTPNLHEGKIMGLAARGQNKGFLDGLFRVEGNKIRATGGRTDYIVVKRLNERCVDQLVIDVAASCQSHFEDVMLKWVGDNYSRETNKLAVSGGCFANVLCNMKIAEMVKDFYVSPPMMDCGLSAGAALSLFDPIPVKKQEHMYFGFSQPPRFDNQFKPSEVAYMISKGKIIGLFQGRMEYGPRALGNRSILADPRDAIVNKTLNARLKRKEYMPFAPVILEEYADEILENYRNGIDNAPFMTNCWKVREEWVDKIPAVVHIDGTARPQVINRNTNEFYYDIVEEFRKLTGIPVLINTSFNIHESPIICWNTEADFAIFQRRIDILVEN